MQTITELRAQLVAIGEAEDGPMFMERPDRWWDNAHYRCVNGHVSTTVLKSERLGRDACLAADCEEALTLTFPEDTDGPLVAPTAPPSTP